MLNRLEMESDEGGTQQQTTKLVVTRKYNLYYLIPVIEFI